MYSLIRHVLLSIRSVIPRLVIQMKPGYDFSILSGEGINLQCTVSNPESLIDVNDGNLIIRKDGSLLAGIGIVEIKNAFIS